VVGGLSLVGISEVAGSTPATLYAGVTAAGSGNCSSKANACTLTTALADTAPGDVVSLVTSGVEGTTSTYYSGGFSIATAGTSTTFPVVIEPAPGVTNPILDGGGASIVLTVANNMYLVIDGVTIQHGYNRRFGGGITNDSGGTLSVTGSTFTGNTALDGGAIDNADPAGTSTLTVTGSTFTGNTATSSGGAIDNGDVGSTGAATVTGSTFTGNTASRGGAIDNADDSGSGTLSVTSSTLTGNTAGDNGGAIDNGDQLGTGTLSVTSSTLTGSTATNGGAIDNGDDQGTGTVTVTGSTFAANGANNGGAIDNNGSILGGGGTRTLTVTGSTFSAPTASNGAIIENGLYNGTGTVVAAADIFAGSCMNSATWTDMGYNVGSDMTCQNGGTGDTTSAILASLLGPLANNGGPTQTMLLLPGNPAAGLIPSSTGVLCPLAADQTGLPSPVGAPCNAGALQPHPTIKSIKVSGTVSAPIVTVKGSGLGTLGNLGPPLAASSCGGGTGSDYSNTISVVNHTKNWNAGEVVSAACSYIGLVVTSYSNTKIVFKFGSDLAFFGGLKAGDSVTVTLLGVAKTFTAAV
jgi:hypothetical protein